MSAAVQITEASVPSLPPHFKLRFDKRRDQWIVQAPERIFVLDPIAHEVVQRCDGEATVETIVDQLAKKFDAPRDVILRDVSALLQDFADKGVMAG